MGAMAQAQEAGLVEASGIEINYKHYAKGAGGQPLLMIHGANGNLHDLDIALLPAAAAARAVVLFDRPGLGRSGRPPGGADPRVQARYLREAAQRLDIRRPILVGHSLGGAVALAYALQFPGDVSGLVLLAPVSYPWKGEPAWYNQLALAPVAGPLFRRLIVPVIGPRMAKASLGGAFPDGYFDDAEVRLLFRPQTFKANAEDLTYLKPAIREMSPHFGALTMPAIILADDGDPTVSTAIHARPLAAAMPEAELRLLPGAGHMIPHSRTQAVLTAIDDVAARAK